MSNIGGEVLDGRCECKTDPCTWQVPLDDDGYKRTSGTRGWYVFGYVPQGMFCKRCGSELRADGTAVTRLQLPEAGEPEERTDIPHYIEVCRWHGHGWCVHVFKQRSGVLVYADGSDAYPKETGDMLAFAAAILAAERLRRKWEAEKEKKDNDK